MTARLVLDAKGFNRRLKRFASVNFERYDELFDATAALAEESIRFGSPRTGSPGQPKRSGDLRMSYVAEKLGRHDVVIASPLVYAGIIEHNTRNARLRSEVGGFHSIAITRLNLRWAIRSDLERITREVVP